jgi:glycosyltransferase involved in cell wall biosynthesis
VRVLHLIKGLGRGGAEQLLLSAARYLDRSRFDHQVAYLLPWKDALVGPLRSVGLEVHCLGGGRSLAWVPRLRWLVRQREVGIVHAHSPLAASLARLSLPPTVRHVYTEHGVWAQYRIGTRILNALTFARNDHVFAVSRQVLDTIRPWPPARTRPLVVEVLYHGIDHAAVASWWARDEVRAELGIADGVPVAGTVANFRPRKGYGVLLRAACQVRKALPEARFVLVGRGPQEGEIRAQARDLGLDSTVIFAGYRDDAQRVISALDVFVLPSFHEGLSIATVEAMALGRPVVVTPVGGQAELVRHGVEGLLVPPGDAAALADAIGTLLADRALRERMGRAARARAAEFDIRRAVERMEEVYAALS